ncbi:hypothetical protein RxyAA322_21680 [Rubrobacter xylanophilus]|uniref:Gram-positive cocci surface proteins LPxTG domain-containing protein n=1 Tax=Rubrobacter xylanophilus TaxID=49319 RepID=A0A510HK86_9ACTN|nr:hypothetical protein [Rubrobacter xylanophilus]BBL80314.1 hypothetical protein RxyAA322_21680 [Rubrobacter xylanophilus]
MRKLAMLAALVGLLACAAPALAQGHAGEPTGTAEEQYEYGTAAGSAMAGRDFIIDVTERLVGEGSGAVRGAGSYVSALGGKEEPASAQVPVANPSIGMTELPDTGGVRVVLLPFGAILLLLAARLIKRSL